MHEAWCVWLVVELGEIPVVSFPINKVPSTVIAAILIKVHHGADSPGAFSLFLSPRVDPTPGVVLIQELDQVIADRMNGPIGRPQAGSVAGANSITTFPSWHMGVCNEKSHERIDVSAINGMGITDS
jgi:hypothetical protein